MCRTHFSEHITTNGGQAFVPGLSSVLISGLRGSLVVKETEQTFTFKSGRASNHHSWGVEVGQVRGSLRVQSQSELYRVPDLPPLYREHVSKVGRLNNFTFFKKYAYRCLCMFVLAGRAWFPGAGVWGRFEFPDVGPGE